MQRTKAIEQLLPHVSMPTTKKVIKNSAGIAAIGLTIGTPSLLALKYHQGKWEKANTDYQRITALSESFEEYFNQAPNITIDSSRELKNSLESFASKSLESENNEFIDLHAKATELTLHFGNDPNSQTTLYSFSNELKSVSKENLRKDDVFFFGMMTALGLGGGLLSSIVGATAIGRREYHSLRVEAQRADINALLADHPYAREWDTIISPFSQVNFEPIATNSNIPEINFPTSENFFQRSNYRAEHIREMIECSNDTAPDVADLMKSYAAWVEKYQHSAMKENEPPNSPDNSIISKALYAVLTD